MTSRRRNKAIVQKTLSVEAAKNIGNETGVHARGDRYDLPMELALKELEAKNCQYVLSEHKSIVSKFGGLSGKLSEVFEDYHRQFVEENPIAWLDRPQVVDPPMTFKLWQYAEPVRRLRLMKWQEREEIRANIKSMLANRGAIKPWMSLEQRFDKTRSFLRNLNAIHDFRTFLLEGPYIATGNRPVRDYSEKTWEIHRRTWSKNIEIDRVNDAATLFEGRRLTQSIELWNDICIECQDKENTPSQCLKRRSAAPRRPGRPNSKKRILAELENRILSGEVREFKSEEASYLQDWLRVEYPDERQYSSSGAIENIIRERHNEWMSSDPIK